MEISITYFKKFFLDLIFPRNCLGCGCEGVMLCGRCQLQLPLNERFSCPLCGQFSFRGYVCFQCRAHSDINGVWIASSYQNELLKKSIKFFKYNFVESLSDPLANLLVRYLKYIQKISPLIRFDLVLPVPLHRRKLLERGFNQAELLAKKVSEVFGWVLDLEILKRQRNTFPQTKLDNIRRKNNIRDAFKVLNRERLLNKNILLVDDVVTTGSTLNECAKSLKAAGAKTVWGLVLAQG